MWWFKRKHGSAEIALERLGSLETELIEYVWPLQEVSVRDLHCRLGPRLAYTTVMTTLDRLYKKGLLQRRKVGKAYVYSPAITEADYRARLTDHFFSLALRDGKYNHAVLSSFVDAVSDNNKEMLDRLDRLVQAKRRLMRRSEQQP